MKVKRQKGVRRTLRFFKTCCGYREPFKVLCDGNFIHHVTSLNLRQLSESIPKFLSASATVYTTKCVISELKLLGDAFKSSTFNARKLQLFRCSHDTPCSASECLLSQVLNGNPQHFFIASQDKALRKRLGQERFVASMFARETAFVLEPPSEFQVESAKVSEDTRKDIGEHEQRVVDALMKAKKIKRKIIAPRVEGEQIENTANDVEDENEQSEDEDDGEEDIRIKKRREFEKDVPKFRRKFSKGPNPLSCKPKKRKVDAKPLKKSSNDESTSSGAKRKRRKPRGDESEKL